MEKAGSGADTEVGYTFHQLNNTQIHGGIYYFKYSNTLNFGSSHNINNIRGAETRLEVPINPNWSITVESSYDNYQHATIMGGLRFDLFASSPTNAYDMGRHMTDPIPRNLGTLKTGSGIPTIKVKRSDFFLIRDNIYFFTSQGGSVFVDPSQSGTFENPLRNDQFSQSVVNQIGNNANLYFNSGNYVINGAGIPPNASINLPLGDSIYGRSMDYKSSAIGDARPMLLGRINLLEGNNTIDSIQLINSETHTGNTHLNLIALSIQNAPNVFLCNDNINATATVNGDLQAGFSNTATGINANNSQVLIENSSISANAVVNGTINQAGSVLFGSNFAAGIGGNATPATSANFTGNSFTILNSTVNGSVSAVDVNGDSFATGIGNAAGDTGGMANFSGNSFLISNSTISSNAASNMIGISTGDSAAIGIGNSRHFGTADFTNNTFTIQNSHINSNTSTIGNNGGVNSAIGIGSWGNVNFTGNNFNLTSSTLTSSTAMIGGDNALVGINEAIGIGNVEFGTSFSNNIFNLTNSNVNSTASVLGSNLSGGFENLAVGIGNISSTAFDNNTFNLASSAVSANATLGIDNSSVNNGNEAIGIGGFSDTSFAGNTFNLTNNSSVSAVGSVGGNNNSFNIVTGIGDILGSNFTGNAFNLTNTTISAAALVGGNNTASSLNVATGIGVPFSSFTGVFTNNTFNMVNSNLNSTSSVNGDNDGTNRAFGVALNKGGNTANINQSIINTLAKVSGTNNGTNAAIGLEATGVGDKIIINNSVVNTTASASGPGTNTALGQLGNVISSNTTYNTTP